MERWDADSEAFDAADTGNYWRCTLEPGRARGRSGGNWASHRARCGSTWPGATAAGIGWPLAADVTDESLVAQLFVNAGVRTLARGSTPSRAGLLALVLELKRPAVNLLDFVGRVSGHVHPNGYAYSRFCQLFREFERRLSPTMRQQHVAGHKLFVDYSGKRAMPDCRSAYRRSSDGRDLCGCILGASSCTYAEATWTQTLPDWIGAHVRMFRFYGAAPPTAGSRQPQERHQQGLILRP